MKRTRYTERLWIKCWPMHLIKPWLDITTQTMTNYRLIWASVVSKSMRKKKAVKTKTKCKQWNITMLMIIIMNNFLSRRHACIQIICYVLWFSHWAFIFTVGVLFAIGGGLFFPFGQTFFYCYIGFGTNERKKNHCIWFMATRDVFAIQTKHHQE